MIPLINLKNFKSSKYLKKLIVIFLFMSPLYYIMSFLKC